MKIKKTLIIVAVASLLGSMGSLTTVKADTVKSDTESSVNFNLTDISEKSALSSDMLNENKTRIYLADAGLWGSGAPASAHNLFDKFYTPKTSHH